MKIEVKTEPLEATLGTGPEENAAPTEQKDDDREPIKIPHEVQEHVGVNGGPWNASRGPTNADERSASEVGEPLVRSSEHSQ